MRILTSTVATLLLILQQIVAVEFEQRSITNENIGRVFLSAPKDWRPIERHHINFGTTFYRLVPPATNFDLEILVNDIKHMKVEVLLDKDLERYIESNMSEMAGQSVERNLKAQRFGAQRDGVYARLTDQAPKPGEYLFFTQGVRLMGTNVVMFTLLSNDKDRAALTNTLRIVESVKVEGKGKRSP